MHVWYKLDDESQDLVAIQDGAVVSDLRDAIKTKWGDRLAYAAPELKVFAAGVDPEKGKPLRADKKVIDLDPTTYDESLVVVANGKFAVSVLDPSI